jgi:predicted DNA-binding transcriptional regulator AlpA
MTEKEKRRLHCQKAGATAAEKRAANRAIGIVPKRGNNVLNRQLVMLANGDRMIGVNEAAAILLVTRVTIYARIKRGHMDAPQELGPWRVGYSLRYIESLIGKSTQIIPPTAQKSAAATKQAA